MDLERRLKEYLITGAEGTYADATGVQHLLRTVRAKLVQGHGAADLERSSFRRELETEAWHYLNEAGQTQFSHLLLSDEDKHELFQRLMHSMFGLGPLEHLLGQPDITEIMINGPYRVFVERGNRVSAAVDDKGRPIRFVDEQELRYVIDKIVAPINKKVDDSEPIVDARLPDGSRVSVVLYPVALSGTTLTIRRFSATPYALDHLVRNGTLPPDAADLLAALVQARLNIIISGGTGTGKTTFLNALSMAIPTEERLVTVEDAAELRLAAAENLVRMETRPPNVEGRGEITIRQLVRAALRMRPDRIIVGEVRGGEALDMLQAMNTGHDGSLTTVHANSAQDLISRLETMVLMAGLELPVSAIRNQIIGAVDLIIHLGRTLDGSRRVTQIAQIAGHTREQVEVEDLFMLDPDSPAPSLIYTEKPLRRWQKVIRTGVRRTDLLSRLLPK